MRLSNTPEDEPPSAEPDRNRAEVRQAALRLLARREHARRELKQKLEIRGYDTQIVSEVLQQLESNGLLDEARFAASAIRSRADRGQGPVRIRHALQDTGLSSDLIAEQLREAEVDWDQVARAAREKRFGAGQPNSFRDRARQVRFLQYRGFTAQQIRSALGADCD